MIYILAQGQQSRWVVDERRPVELPCEYKHHIPINGESNIMRTIRLVELYHNTRYTVVAHGNTFTPQQINRLPNRLTTLHYPGNILHGVWQLLGKHTGQTTFLLGDVIYSEQTLADILTYDEREYTLWGRHGENVFTGKKAGEIFALTVSKEAEPLLREQLKTIKEIEMKLWGLKNHWLFSGYWEEIDDWTDDIDSPEEYQLFYSKLNELAKPLWHT